MLSFSGFGTLGVVHSSERNADFTSTTFKPHGAGYTRAWSAEVDSLIAAQVTANLTSRITAVVQVISEQNYDGTFRPHVEWANFKYRFTPDFSMRVGRTVLPFFMVADSRKIGYANPWVRPPVEMYGLVPLSSNDGIDATLRTQLGGGINTITVTAGQSSTRLPAVTAEARELVAVVNTFEHGSVTARVNYGRARLTVPESSALFDGFRQFGPQGMAIVDKYLIHRREVSFMGVAASYDPGAWFVTAEWSALNAPPAVGKKSAWYVSGGHRFGKLTPYATYGQARADNLSDPGLDLSNLPPQAVAPANELNYVLNNLLFAKPVQKTISIGVRWDFIRNTALKLQLDHTRVGSGSTGTLNNLQPGFRPGGKFNVLSATMDFVF